MGLYLLRRTSPNRRGFPLSYITLLVLRSSPTEKALPSPVRTIALAFGFFSPSLRASWRSVPICSLNALSTSGRFNLIQRTEFLTSALTAFSSILLTLELGLPLLLESPHPLTLVFRGEEQVEELPLEVQPVGEANLKRLVNRLFRELCRER